jgi:O-antigen ligase
MTTASATASQTSLVRYARWSLYATVACLPLYVVRWHYGPIPTTLLETLIIVTTVLYVGGRWREGRRRPVVTGYEIPIAILLLAGAISIFVAKDHRGALGLYRAYFIEPVIIFYVAVDLLRRAQHVGWLLVAFAVGSSLFAILNLIVFMQSVIAHSVHVGVAPNALYGDANYVAMYMEPPVAMAIGLILFGTTPRWRLAGAAWFAITATALLFSFSKGSWLAMGGVALAMAFSVPRWGVPILLGSGAVAFLISRIPLIAERWSLADVSIGGRISLINGTVKMLRGSPIFGFGLGGYSFQFRGSVPEIYPHNIWLTFWVEIGLLGVLAFAVILFALWWQGWRAWARSGDMYRPAVWGASAALVAWFVHGFVDSPYWKNDMSTEFWILAALIVVTSMTFVRARSHAV